MGSDSITTKTVDLNTDCSTEGLTVGGILPSSTVPYTFTSSDSSDYKVDAFNGTYTIDTSSISDSNVDWGSTIYGHGGTYIDTELVESNPTCKALWDQFTYVYEMVKNDKENEEQNDIPF